jgi:hypothetical protein
MSDFKSMGQGSSIASDAKTSFVDTNEFVFGPAIITEKDLPKTMLWSDPILGPLWRSRAPLFLREIRNAVPFLQLPEHRGIETAFLLGSVPAFRMLEHIRAGFMYGKPRERIITYYADPDAVPLAEQSYRVVEFIVRFLLPLRMLAKYEKDKHFSSLLFFRDDYHSAETADELFRHRAKMKALRLADSKSVVVNASDSKLDASPTQLGVQQLELVRTMHNSLQPTIKYIGEEAVKLVQEAIKLLETELDPVADVGYDFLNPNPPRFTSEQWQACEDAMQDLKDIMSRVLLLHDEPFLSLLFVDPTSLTGYSRMRHPADVLLPKYNEKVALRISSTLPPPEFLIDLGYVMATNYANFFAIPSDMYLWGQWCRRNPQPLDAARFLDAPEPIRLHHTFWKSTYDEAKLRQMYQTVDVKDRNNVGNENGGDDEMSNQWWFNPIVPYGDVVRQVIFKAQSASIASASALPGVLAATTASFLGGASTRRSWRQAWNAHFLPHKAREPANRAFH